MILKKLIFILIFLPFFSNSQDFGKLPFKSWTSFTDYSKLDSIGEQIIKENIFDTCIVGNCQNGEGTMIYIDLMGNRNGNPPGCRATYTGNWKNGKRSGFGIFTKENCISGDDFRIYTGEWLNDKRHGKGVDVYAPKGASAGNFELIDDNSLKKMNANTVILDGNWFEDKLKGKAEIIEFCCDKKDVFNVYFKNNLKNGFGTFKSSGGYEYKGYYKDDYQNGQGTYTFPGGGKYVGKWKDDYQNGQGTFTYSSGNKYVGEWKDGKYHGQGTYSYSDGRKYVGNWKNDKKDGEGFQNYVLSHAPLQLPRLIKNIIKYNYSPPKNYDGNYVNGEFEGQGSIIFEDGSLYNGQFKKGEISGDGEYRLANGYLVYKGAWESGIVNGNGKFTLVDGSIKYQGAWKDGLISGFGKYNYSNGDSYEGFYIDGRKNGIGKFIYNDGTVFEGSFKKNLENGKGVITYLDGMQYKSYWSSSIDTILPLSFDDAMVEAHLILKKNIDNVEGVYRYINKSSNSKYKFLILKSDFTYYGFIIEGECTYCTNWSIGDIKFQMSTTAVKDVYDVLWRYPRQQRKKNDEFIFFSEMNGAIISDKKEISLLKLFPDYNIHDIKNKGNYKNVWAGNGSGIIISKSGHIVTNHHVIDGANDIEVEFMYQNQITSFNAKVIKSDENNDLAIIKIDDPKFKNLTNIPYSFKTRSSDVGTEVFALGYPMALTIMGKDIKFTDGKISSKTGFKGDITTYQTTTPIQAGNSGGPLFDFNGNLIGINSSGLDKGLADNVSYSIKSRYLLDLIDVLPESIELPSSKELASKPLTEQIKVLSDYVVLIKVK